MSPDIRWRQRYQNFQRAFARLDEAVQLQTTKPFSDLEKEGVVQRFEFT